jgi:hypothetical protein
MGIEEEKEILINLLKSKSALKQRVHEQTVDWFGIFKKELNECVDTLSTKLTDKSIRLKTVDKGPSEIQLFIGSDILVFHMHSNIFRLPNHDYSVQTSYVQNDPSNAFCGIINVYDFLADSYEFNRPNDLGYLICRIFINKENHFKIEGKGKIGVVYQNFMNQVLTEDIVQEIILKLAVYAIDFDLLTPPYQAVSQVSVGELQQLSSNSKLKTGKRLGFKFQAESNISG